jgi:hypothetical protein
MGVNMRPLVILIACTLQPLLLLQGQSDTSSVRLPVASDTTMSLDQSEAKPLLYAPLPGADIKWQPNPQLRRQLRLGQPYRPGSEAWQIDSRTSSYYTPPWVQEDHLIDMGRDPGTIWLSPYTAALIGLAVLDEMYLREQYTELLLITPLRVEEVLIAGQHLVILEALWQDSPQTMAEIEKNPGIGMRMHGSRLSQAMQTLADNRLVAKTGRGTFSPEYSVQVSREDFIRRLRDILDEPRHSEANLRNDLRSILQQLVVTE